jgi:hypothetical protein
MTYPFSFFELLWAFEGKAHNDNCLIHYYGVAIGYWFFGIVTTTLRKD